MAEQKQSAEAFGQQFAARMFSGRKGHGQGPCSYIRVSESDLSNIIAAAFELRAAELTGRDLEQMLRTASELDELNLKLHGGEHNDYRPGIVFAAALMRAVANGVATVAPRYLDCGCVHPGHHPNCCPNIEGSHHG